MGKLSWLLFGDDEQRKQGKQVAKYARLAGFVFLCFTCLFVLSFLFSFLRYILGFAVLAGAGYGAWLLSKPWRQKWMGNQQSEEEPAPADTEQPQVDPQAIERLSAKYADEPAARDQPEKPRPTTQQREQRAKEQLAEMKRMRRQ